MLGHEICGGCGHEIDPEVCHCGSAMKDHGYFDGHSPVPMGCGCGYSPPDYAPGFPKEKR